ncbi:MAG: desulfoferrodoxin family protein [Filifactoraceae bacterium]
MAKFMICKHCGNLVEMVHSAGVKIMCCGEAMEEIVANTTDASQEKHVPVVSVEESKVRVSVGSVAHPMTQEHHINWIYLVSDEGVQRKHLAVDAQPDVEFYVSNQKNIEVYAYCNLHGLWKA